MGWFMPAIFDMLTSQSVASGSTVSMADGQTVFDITNTTLIALLTVNLPPNPTNGQRAIIASGAAVTLLTIAAVPNAQGVTPSIRGTLATLSASGYIRFNYSGTTAQWVRTG